jgi:hypothetical protein
MEGPALGAGESPEAQELLAATNEMLRRIGRNLLNFQKIEALLKFLLAYGRISGPMREFASIREAQVAATSRKMMGALVRTLADGMLSDTGGNDELPGDARQPWLHFRVAFEPAEPFADLRRDLEALVLERNELVHNFLPKWDAKSVEATRRLSEDLDVQRERLIPVYNRLSNLVTTLQDGAKAHAEFLASPEAQEQLESWLSSRR